MVTIVLYAAGVLLVLAAFELFACRPAYRLNVTVRDAANFAGDIEAWLRSESR